MYKLLKQEVEHNLAQFICTDNLIPLALATIASIKILKENDALELLHALDEDIKVRNTPIKPKKGSVGRFSTKNDSVCI